MSSVDALIAPLQDADSREICGVRLDIVRVASARVKRTIYPPDFRWSAQMKAFVGTESCMHTHVGFLAQGQIHVHYSDGCTLEYAAPQVVSIAPGRDAWVLGDEPAVLIEFDFERETADRLGVPEIHRH